MAFIIRILTGLFLIVILGILIGLVIYGLVWLINRGVQWLADSLGYEVTDFFVWLRSKLPEKKFK